MKTFNPDPFLKPGILFALKIREEFALSSDSPGDGSVPFMVGYDLATLANGYEVEWRLDLITMQVISRFMAPQLTLAHMVFRGVYQLTSIDQGRFAVFKASDKYLAMLKQHIQEAGIKT